MLREDVLFTKLLEPEIVESSRCPQIASMIVQSRRAVLVVGSFALTALACICIGIVSLSRRSMPHRSGLTYEDIFGHNGIRGTDVVRRAANLGMVDLFSEIDAHDISQGMLGDCYFDAVLASIAHVRPDIIEDMFIDRQYWPEGVYTTQWFVGNNQITVAVNDEVPTSAEGFPFFLWTNSELSVWPALLEKSWAKVCGSYKALEYGYGSEPFVAITGLQPSWYAVDYTEDNKLWSMISEALQNSWPMVSGTGVKGAYGIQTGHEYSIFEIADDYYGHGRAIRIRNPWGTNNYTGQIPLAKGHEVGDFWCTWKEFKEATLSVFIARLFPGYQPTAPVAILPNRHAWIQFDASTSEPFTLQMMLPPGRLRKSVGCRGNSTGYSYIFQAYVPSGRTYTSMSAYTDGRMIEFPGEVGTYRVYAYLAPEFECHQIFISAFAPKSFTISSSGYYDEGLVFDRETELLVEHHHSFDEQPHQLASRNDKEVSQKTMGRRLVVYANCQNVMSQIRHLNNAMHIILSGTDPIFPETIESIAAPGVFCGDEAHGFERSCSYFNHWMSLEKILQGFKMGQACAVLEPNGHVCEIGTRCDENASFFCSIVGCDERLVLQPGFFYSNIPRACCNCKPK